MSSPSSFYGIFIISKEYLLSTHGGPMLGILLDSAGTLVNKTAKVLAS